MSTSDSYDPDRYDRPSVTVDVVVFSLLDQDLRVLLIKRDYVPYEGMWAIPGGFIQMDESLEESAARQLREKTGADDVYMEQLYTFGEPARDPRMRVLTVAYFAIVPVDEIELTRPGTIQWFSLTNLPQLAFDHTTILDYALTRLRYKLEYTMVGFRLLPDLFTLSELQRAYETVLGEPLDKRNFRRKIQSADIIEKTGQKRKEGEGRPAMLYRYLDDAVAEVKTRRLFP